MPVEITMPQLSDTMTEGTVVKWLKNEGDKIKSGDIIAEVETDKATMEMESFEAGTLAVRVAGEGDSVPVGQAIAVLATGKESVDEVKKNYTPAKAASTKPTESEPAEAPAPARSAETPSTKRGDQFAPGSEGQHGAETAGVHDAAAATAVATRPASQDRPARTSPSEGDANDNGAGDRIKISPLARRIAEAEGVDYTQIDGSGPGGRIVQKDVLAHIESGAPAKAASDQPAPAALGAAPQLPQRVASGESETIELSKMRLTIATRLQQSKQQIPHFYESIDIDMEALTTLRKTVNQQLEKQKVRLSISDFINKAIAAALREHPAVNAHFDAKNNRIIRYGDVHLGIAVAIPDGLIVPVLRSIDQMGLREIRQKSVDLVERARAQRLKRDEMSGATFTVSTLGMYGIREFSAIINPPEVGILAVGAAEPRAVVRDGQIVARNTMTVTLSVDHRAVDGATAAEFLQTLKALLEEPGMMLV